MAETHYLYLITRADNETYVGVSKRPGVRLREHQLGWGNKELAGHDLTITILDQGSSEYIYGIEDTYIKKLGATLNIAKGGFGGGGNYAKGSKNGSAKLCEQSVLDIRIAASLGESQAALSRLYDVSAATISNICKHKVWKEVGGPVVSGQASTLSKDLVAVILELRRTGASYSKIVEHTGVSRYVAHKYCSKEGL